MYYALTVRAVSVGSCASQVETKPATSSQPIQVDRTRMDVLLHYNALLSYWQRDLKTSTSHV